MPYQLEPMKKPHNNLILKGWGDDVHDLGVTKVFHHGVAAPFLYSTWKVASLWERIKFLFKGEVTIGVMGHTAPPISIMIGEYDFEEVSDDA